MLVLAFLFNAGVIFLLLAFIMKFPKNVAFFSISSMFFLVLGVIIPTTASDYYPAGWLFILLGIVSGVLGAIFGVGGLVNIYGKEEWEEEEIFIGE